VQVKNQPVIQTTGKIVDYTLVSAISGSGMIFVGKAGAIDGQTNPDLKAGVGDTVRVTLNSGEGAMHNIRFDGVDKTSDKVTGKGNQVVLEFTAGADGTYAYYCDIPGHRQAGMQGKFIVGSGVGPPIAAATTSKPMSAGMASSSAPVMGLADPNAADIVRDPTDLPAPVGSREPTSLRVDLETVEVSGKLADRTTYTYWTFNGKVQGPFIRVRLGDTVEVHLKNSAGSSITHSVGFHAVTGPGSAVDPLSTVVRY
jgi:nitrite reductase (NO-forming)